MRLRWVYDRSGNAVEVTEGYGVPVEDKASHHVMRDIAPYRSMIDGTLITSRSRHREHLKAHNCIEVGNDSSLNGQPKPLESPPGLKRMLIEVANSKLRWKE